MLFECEYSVDERNGIPTQRHSMYQWIGDVILDTKDEEEETVIPRTWNSMALVFHLIKKSATVDLFKMNSTRTVRFLT